MLAALQMLAADRVGRDRRGRVPSHTPRRLPYRSTCSRGLNRKPSSLQISASHSARSRKPAGSVPSGIRMTRSAVRRERRHQLAHLLQIVRLRDHELQLIIVARHQLREHRRLDAQALVLRRPAALGRGVGQLGADAHQVAGDRVEHGPGGLDGDVQARRRAVARVSGMISGAIIGSPPVTTTCRAGCARTSSRICRSVRSTPSGLPRRVGRVAPGAAQVAPAGADEDRRHADQRSFALQRIEQLSDLQCPASSNPLRRSRQESHCAARPAGGVGIVATVGEREIAARVRCASCTIPPCVSCSSGVWIFRRVRPSTRGLGGQVRHAFVGLDEFRPAIGIARVVERVHADEDVGRFQHLGPRQRERKEDRVARRNVGDRDSVRHLAGRAPFRHRDVGR